VSEYKMAGMFVLQNQSAVTVCLKQGNHVTTEIRKTRMGAILIVKLMMDTYAQKQDKNA